MQRNQTYRLQARKRHCPAKWCRKSGGHQSGAKMGGGKIEGNFFWIVPPFFGSTSTISRFGERFRGAQYIRFLFAVLLHRVPPWGTLKMRDWKVRDGPKCKGRKFRTGKCGTKMQGWKMQEHLVWKAVCINVCQCYHIAVQMC